jgi:hypothetical protein
MNVFYEVEYKAGLTFRKKKRSKINQSEKRFLIEAGRLAFENQSRSGSRLRHLELGISKPVQMDIVALGQDLRNETII